MNNALAIRAKTKDDICRRSRLAISKQILSIGTLEVSREDQRRQIIQRSPGNDS